MKWMVLSQCISSHLLFAGSIQDLEILLCSSDWVEYFVATRRVEELPRCPIVTFTVLTPRIAALAQYKGTFATKMGLVAVGRVARDVSR